MNVSLTSVMGHRRITGLLEQALESDGLSHAYLLEGPDGLGKTTLARELCMALLCTEDSVPCGNCNACCQVRAGTHAEFRWIQAPEEEKKQAALSVDLVRGMIKDIYLKPYRGERKVYVIPEAHTMTPQAQNALLKTLEEPPSHSVTLLITPEPERLLPTILSRCQRLSFRPVQGSLIQRYLEQEKKLPPEKASHLTAYAWGIPGRALDMLENEKEQKRYKQFLHLMDSFSHRRFDLALESCAMMQEDRREALRVLALWQEWLRDIKILQAGGSREQLIHKNQVRRLKSQQSLFPLSLTTTALSLLETARRDLLSHGNLAFVTESLVMTMLHLVQHPEEARSIHSFLA